MNNFKGKTTNDKEKSWTHFSGLCKSCGLCILRCPVKCLSWDKDRLTFHGLSSIKVDIKKCISCKICDEICPDSAICVKKILPNKNNK